MSGRVRAPVVEGACPLPGAPDVEGEPARLQHRAVDDARWDRRDLARRDGHHDLVDLRQARIRFTEHDLRLAESEPGERDDVGVAEGAGEFRRAFECRRGPFAVACVERGEALGNEQQPMVWSAARVLFHSRCARANHPPPRARSPRPISCIPSQAAHRVAASTSPFGEVGLVGTCQRVEALLETSDQDRRDGELLEV